MSIFCYTLSAGKFHKGEIMDLNAYGKRSFEQESLDDDFEADVYADWDKELESSIRKNQKKRFVKKKLEERLERKKLKYDINDYDEELEDFDWDHYE